MMELKTVAAYKRIVDSVESLYEVTFRNGWMLPSLKSSLVTESYLHGVIEGKIYCPMAEDLKFKQCYSPPTVATLIEKV